MSLRWNQPILTLQRLVSGSFKRILYYSKESQIVSVSFILDSNNVRQFWMSHKIVPVLYKLTLNTGWTIFLTTVTNWFSLIYIGSRLDTREWEFSNGKERAGSLSPNPLCFGKSRDLKTWENPIDLRTFHRYEVWRPRSLETTDVETLPDLKTWKPEDLGMLRFPEDFRIGVS